MNVKRFSVALVLAASVPLAAQQIQISKDNKTIAITTEGQASALADTAVVTVGFHSFGKDQDATYAQATQISNAIITSLTASGVPKETIASEEQRLNALQPGNDDDKARFAQGLRFEFTQSWHVTVPASQASAVLHVAVLSGANESGAIDWQLRDDAGLQADAARQALEHARDIAERMAHGLGAKLGGLVYASNQTPPRGIMGLLAAQGQAVNIEESAMAMSKANLKPLAIAPQRITKNATVYAVFAIE